MSIQSKLKETVKQILTDRCGREYERTYFHAQKYSGYSNVIEAAEEKQLKQWMEGLLPKEMPSYKLVEYEIEAEKDYVSEGLSGEENGEADWIVYKDARVTLSGQALLVLQVWMDRYPRAVFLYGDEDVISADGKRECPWLKPDWSPSLFESMFYIGGVFGVRRSLLLELAKTNENVACFAYRVLKHAGAFEKRNVRDENKGFGETAVLHIPYVLCHHETETDYETYMRRTAVEAQGVGAAPGTEEEKERTITSVIIPSKDHPDVLERNLVSLVETAKREFLEIVIVDNGSTTDNKTKIEKLIHDLTEKANRSIRMKYVYNPMEFHFSKMCNMGAAASAGEYLLFLNDDTESLENGWIERIRREASKPYTGAVGVKLLYPASDKIQHAGIVNLPMGPVHKLQFQSDEKTYYFGRNHITTNVLAVTGACLMVKRERFDEVGGFSEELPVAFNDVDLCFSLYEKGYHNVVMNDFVLYHYESLSRGDDEAPEKIKRLERERAKLYERHPKLAAVDPYYHIYLNREGLDTRIVPAPEEWLSGGSETVWAKEIDGSILPAEEGIPEECTDAAGGKVRLHKGLYVRVESVGGNFLQGYSFMAGDDNACYEKKLLFVNIENGTCYEALPGKKLRQDLQDNMPDQKHVAMSGFSVNVCGLPSGEYKIGIMAANKVSRITYVNYCARSLSISE